MKVAYLVHSVEWPDMILAIAAETPNKARYRAWVNGYYAGYDLKYIDYRAQRAPQFDKLAAEQEDKMGWNMGWIDGGDSWGCLKKEAEHAR